jgi:ferric-dicitrate binding protein FerR (iron transport regulator)
MTDETIVRVLQGRASDIEERQLLEWRSASLENARHFRDIAAVWALTDGKLAESIGGGAPPAAEIRALAHRRRWSLRSIAGGSGNRGVRTVAALAGTAAVVLLAVFADRVRRTDRVAEGQVDAALFVTRELTTNASEMVTVRLDDGTIVRLGPESRLRFGGPSYGEREVSLDGKAYFAVAKDSARPFRVHTSGGEVNVLGTRFELTAEKKDLRLIVIQGLVEIDAGTRSVKVGAGQISHLVEGAAPVVLPARDAFAGVDEWVGQVLFFEATPLDQVAREISEHYRTHVRLADSSLASRTVTASFINRTFDDVLTVVCRVASVTCTVNGDTTTISR